MVGSAQGKPCGQSRSKSRRVRAWGPQPGGAFYASAAATRASNSMRHTVAAPLPSPSWAIQSVAYMALFRVRPARGGQAAVILILHNSAGAPAAARQTGVNCDKPDNSDLATVLWT